MIGRDLARGRWLHGLIELAGRGRPWYANKVVVILWPGTPSDYKVVEFCKFKAVPFSTHLEAGIFVDLHPRGWSYMMVSSKTHCIDLTNIL